MAAMQLPKGLIVDMITPLLNNGGVDGRGLERHLKMLMPHAQAIFIAGPYMGEGIDLNPEQREELFHQTLLIIQSRMPVLVYTRARLSLPLPEPIPPRALNCARPSISIQPAW